jgi:hypothetical protein
MNWCPAIYHSSFGVYILPRPVITLDPKWTQDSDPKKVPKLAGGFTYGFSWNPVKIHVAGQFNISAGTTPLVGSTESDKITELQSMVTKLSNVISSADAFYEFFMFYNSGTGVYLKFKSCWTEAFMPQLGDGDRTTWPYQIDIVANDPVLYTTAPGA